MRLTQVRWQETGNGRTGPFSETIYTWPNNRGSGRRCAPPLNRSFLPWWAGSGRDVNRPLEIFFSYAHEDENLMDDVRRQLIVYETLYL
jgi:hypothetical protein